MSTNSTTQIRSKHDKPGSCFVHARLLVRTRNRRNIKRIERSLTYLILCGLVPAISQAEVFVHVTNASQVAYQAASNGYVYIRNMNQFDSNALARCYSYWIDTTTQPGKNFFAIFLALAAQ